MFPEEVWGYSSAGRAPALQAGGQRFDPVSLHQNSPDHLCVYKKSFKIKIFCERAALSAVCFVL